VHLIILGLTKYSINATHFPHTVCITLQHGYTLPNYKY